MCSVWLPVTQPGFELCQPKDPDDYERIITSLNGESRANDWRSPVMKLIRADEGRILAESDAPWIGSHTPIFRPSAVKALGELLLRYGELLPLHCGGIELSIYNVTTVLDALDDKASSIVRFRTGTVMMIRNYVFRPQIVDGIDVFKIPNLHMSPTFVGGRFVEAWKAAGLRGWEFKRLWSAD